jgi:hypothetical protein
VGVEKLTITTIAVEGLECSGSGAKVLQAASWCQVICLGSDKLAHQDGPILPTNLCGVLTGQHIYLSVKDLGENAVTLNLKLDDVGSQRWAILVRQFVTSQTDYLAPRGCLQYFRSTAGTLKTFNSNGGNGELLNAHMYSACIAQTDVYCDVSLNSALFDLTGASGSCSDKITLGCQVLCGDTFGSEGTLTCKLFNKF